MTMLWALASALVIAAAITVMVTTSVNALVFDPLFYESGQARHAVGQTTEYTLEQLRPINSALVAFFRSTDLTLPAALERSGVDPAVFNAREVGHMDDVRLLIHFVGRLQMLSAVVVAGVVAARLLRGGPGRVRWLTDQAVAAGASGVILVVAFGALTLIDFQRLFTYFHLLSFDNDLWLLDPRTDNLIRFFPFNFWLEATVTVAIQVVFSALILALAALLVRRFARGITA